MTRILEGDGRASRAQRLACFERSGLDEPLRSLVDKVAEQPTRVSDDDFAAAKASGLTDDELFEIVICAAVGEASRRYDAAMAALDEALEPRG